MNQIFPQKNIAIAGYRANITDLKIIDQLKKHFEGTIQLLDARGIAGKEHIYHATLHALLAFQRKENIAKDLGLEICIRTSAQRQITKALDMIGLKKGNTEVCAVLIGENNFKTSLEEFLGSRDDSILEPNEKYLKRLYGISDTEIRAAGNIKRCLMERTSLLILNS